MWAKIVHKFLISRNWSFSATRAMNERENTTRIAEIARKYFKRSLWNFFDLFPISQFSLNERTLSLNLLHKSHNKSGCLQSKMQTFLIYLSALSALRLHFIYINHADWSVRVLEPLKWYSLAEKNETVIAKFQFFTFFSFHSVSSS